MSIKKILILTPGLGSGGAQKVFKEQLIFYSEHFATTGCIFNWDGALEDERHVVLLSLDVPAGKHWFSKFYFFCQRVMRVRAVKRKFKFDISISHLEGADYVNILSRQGEKVICYIHGSKFHDGEIRGFLGWARKNIFMPYVYQKTNLIVPVSVGIQREFLDEFEMPSKNFKVITNGVDIERIEQQAKETIPAMHQALVKTHKIICACSRLAIAKNLHALLSVFAKILESEKCKLIILGDGDLRNSLIDQAKKLGLRGYNTWSNMPFSDDFDVYFLGNQANPFPYITQSSFFTLPSSWEGFPLALCEAMACGVPVVASDCPTGPREILYDEIHRSEFGFLLPIPDERNDKTLHIWTETLVNLLRNDTLRSEYAEKAVQRVKNFTKKNMEAAWLEIVND